MSARNSILAALAAEAFDRKLAESRAELRCRDIGSRSFEHDRPDSSEEESVEDIWVDSGV